MSFFRSSLIVSFWTFCTRISGFLREMVMAFLLGAGPLTDIFNIAFRLPNFFRKISAEGAFNSAFIPCFSSILTQQGKQEALRFASNILSLMIIILVTFVLVIEQNMQHVLMFLAPGFDTNSEHFHSMKTLGQIMFPYILLVSVVSLLAGILNSVGKFANAASTQIISNICMISGLYFLAEFTKTPVHALAYGVIIGGVAQLLWVMEGLRREKIKLSFQEKPRLDPEARTVFKRMVPGIFSASISQCGLVVDTIMASFITGSISYLSYADRLHQFPLAIIGTGMGLVLLPSLTKAYLSSPHENEASFLHNRALELGLILALPSAIGLFMLSDHLVKCIFEHGAFTEFDTAATSKALRAYVIGLPAWIVTKILLPAFFARGDTKTPLKIGGGVVLCNILLDLALVPFFSYVGIAYASACAAWINAIALFCYLSRKKLLKLDKMLLFRLPDVMLASMLMGGVLWGIDVFISSYFSNALFVLYSIFLGGGFYLLFLHGRKAFTWQDWKKLRKT